MHPNTPQHPPVPAGVPLRFYQDLRHRPTKLVGKMTSVCVSAMDSDLRIQIEFATTDGNAGSKWDVVAAFEAYSPTGD